MSTLKAKDLSKIGYTNDQARSLVINTVSKHYKHHSREELITLLIDIRTHPETYLNDEKAGKIAATFLDIGKEEHFNVFSLSEEPGPLKIIGGKEIESSAKQQMEGVMSLPVTIRGALMPDAHTGYGLPIGSVVAVDNAVIPFGVGVDIGCRMALSILDESDSFLRRYSHHAKQALKEYTHFGMEGGLGFPQEHEVLDSPVFQSTDLLRKLQGKASRQLGSSGSGNHFVEFGEIELLENNSLGLPPKKYLALLSHSGSRGLGANIAQHYTQIAMNTCKLPAEVQQLAWLDLDSEAGKEYWLSMNLAGDYAKACHDRIHANLLKALGLQSLVTVENHHNFAWKDRLGDGREVVIHRK
ncbi:MAG TPA: RtcB family protein, partial [Puia sp.]|nr:RtcB family protein [Puia sp.]